MISIHGGGMSAAEAVCVFRLPGDGAEAAGGGVRTQQVPARVVSPTLAECAVPVFSVPSLNVLSSVCFVTHSVLGRLSRIACAQLCASFVFFERLMSNIW